MGGNTFRPFGGPQVAVIGGEDVHDQASCFADEVVIDFPSVAPAVDRMRSSFLAEERGAALPTAIQLSPREAIAGATRSLHVPVRCTCHDCGGRGGTWTEACRRCEGSGTELLQHRLQVLLPAGVADGACFYFTVTPRHHPPTRIELRVHVA
jgi:DnaJ-class molecular chaperone